MACVVWRLQDRAPPARRFAGQARSHICCNVAMPVEAALSALVHVLKQGGAAAAAAK